MSMISLVISTYNWPEALKHVLLSAFEQSILPVEIIIADDGSGLETRHLIKKIQKKSPIPLKHVWHEDQGFRRTVILNKAIRNAAGKYIVQTDGDCILSRRFIKDHLTMAKPGLFLYGTRVDVPQNLFKKRIQQGEKFHIRFFDRGIRNRHRSLYWPDYTLRWAWIEKFFSNSRSQSIPYTISGCNMSFWKMDFFKVNGYNEEITGWGFEDSELAFRFLHKGLKSQRLKFQAILYHIDHGANFKKETHALIKKNRQIFQHTLQHKMIRCRNGLCKGSDQMHHMNHPNNS
ncbi:MAG: glycosyltransferase family 2 protein [Flavobacteriales bacterium AspAUS03]